MSRSKRLWLTCLKSIIFASLATLGVFLLSSIIIAAVLEKIKNEFIRDVAIQIIMMVMYAVFFYRFHMHNRLSTYADHTDKLDLKQELAVYLRAEGKIMFVIYSIIVVVAELSLLFTNNAPQNPIVFATMFCLGPWMSLKIPVLRSVIAFTYSAIVICLLTILRSRKIHEEENLNKDRKNQPSNVIS